MQSRNHFKIILAALLVFFSTVRVFYVTGIAQDRFTFLGGYAPQQEVQIGQQLDKQVRSKYKVTTNARLQQYVSSVGRRIAAQTHTSYPYTYTVLQDDKTINAFSGPGGYVYITTGILGILGNESQLAAVLGHETGHVVMHHVLKHMKEQSYTSMGLSLLGRYNPALSGMLGQAGQFLLLQKFSRNDESQADDVGVHLITMAGYNPNGMTQLLIRLAKQDGGSRAAVFLQNHPASADRARQVDATIHQEGLAHAGQITDTPQFDAIIGAH